MSRFKVVVVFLFSIFLFSLSAMAEAIAESDELNKIKNKIVSIDQKHRQEMAKVYELNEKIKKVVDEKGRMDDKMIILNSQAKGIAKKIVGLESKTKDQKKRLHRRLRTLYKMSGQSLMKVLFSGSSKGDVDRNLRFLSIVAQKDHEEIKNFTQLISQLQKEKKKLGKTVASLLRVKSGIKAKENTLLSQQKKRARLMKRLLGQRQKNVDEIKKLRLKQTDSLQPMAGFHQKFFFEKKGQLPPPTQSPLVQKFGLISGVNSGVQLSHKGYRFQNTESRNVYAIDRGKVSFVGAISGYGSAVIIDHGDEYYSVYGQLGEVFVAQGDHVAAETLIASVSQVSDVEKGLYFEIRHFSQPQDPAKWLREKDFKISSAH